MKNIPLKITLLTLCLFGVATLTHASTPVQPGYHVNKVFDIVPNDPKGNKKVVLITIDDGPSKQSKGMVDTLTKHKVKAIFFINGNHVKNYKDAIPYEYKNGNAIGNHTWDHPNLKQIKFDKIVKEIDSNTKIIKDATGSTVRFFRPPFGVSTQAVRDYVKKQGMISMNWSGAAKDWEKSAQKKEVFINNVMKDLHPGSISLLHEHPWSASSLDELLTQIAQKGYTFVDPKDITN